MKKSTKVLIAGAITLTTAAVATSIAYATTKLLVETALSRNQPKIIQKAGAKIAGSSVDTEIMETVKGAAKTLADKPHKVIEIKGYEGERLVGHLFETENAKRIIVAMHGWRSSWNVDFGMIHDFWVKNGCSVLYTEQRGQGGSGGEYMGFGLVERHDCFEWVNWVTENIEGDAPIYLAGVSMGASTVLMASGFELPSRVHGIIADCGFTSPDAIWRHVAGNNLHLLYSIHAPIANSLCKRRINFGPRDYSTVDALKETSIPVMFVHGTDDDFVPITMTYENYKACASPKKLLVVPGADHAMSYVVDSDAYEAATTEFWAEND